MKRHYTYFTYLIYLAVAIYLCWYASFESAVLADKIDTHIHYIRSLNIQNSLKNFILFPSWHADPFWGYPEDFNYSVSYYLMAILGAFFTMPIAIKIFHLLAYLLMGLSARRFLRLFYTENHQVLLGSIAYMGSSSFVNFGIGSGSITRLAGIAFFPYLLVVFVDWYQSPSRKKRFKLSLIVYLSYLIHPFSTICGVATSIIYSLIIKSPLNGVRYIKEILKLASLCIVLFSWQLGSLLISKNYISWDEVYAQYAQYLLPVDLLSFIGIWYNSVERTNHFYFGLLPFLLSIIAPFIWIKKKDSRKILWFGFTLSLVGFCLIISGSLFIKRNTFRFDMIYNLGTAICLTYVLSLCKNRILTFCFILLIVVEQTWYARPFGGGNYLSEVHLKEFEQLIPKDFIRPRVLLSPDSFWVVSPLQAKWLSPSYGLNFQGFLELTPYNIGMLPFHGNIKNTTDLLQFLGVPLANQQSQLGVATEYEQYLIINAQNRKESYNMVYKHLLASEGYNAYQMPLVFRQNEGELSIESKDKQLRIYPKKDLNWKSKTIAFFKNNLPVEKDMLYPSLNKLLVIKEASHPRHTLHMNKKGIKQEVVEPGLIGVIVEKDTKVGKIQMVTGFTLWEKILGFLSLFSFLSILTLYLKKDGTPHVHEFIDSSYDNDSIH